MVEENRVDVAAYNERSLNTLDRAIAFSRGEFSLVLVRCNYKRLRDRLMRELKKTLGTPLPNQRITSSFISKNSLHNNPNLRTWGMSNRWQ